MDDEARDTLLVGLEKDVGYVVKRLDDGALTLKDHEKRIRSNEIKFGILGAVWIVLGGAVSYLYKIALGGGGD